MANEDLRRELLAMRDADLQRRKELAKDGSLYDGYHPRMEEVHRQNAARLRELIAVHGWPGNSLAGEDGAEAAWLVVQHAIGEPEFQRQVLHVLRAAAEAGDVPAWQPAYLEDRICMYEGRPQIYGTQFVPDENGVPQPWTIADPEHVNERRAALGLDTLQQRAEHFRQTTPPEARPKDYAAWRRGYEEWVRKVGWRK